MKYVLLNTDSLLLKPTVQLQFQEARSSVCTGGGNGEQELMTSPYQLRGRWLRSGYEADSVFPK